MITHVPNANAFESDPVVAADRCVLNGLVEEAKYRWSIQGRKAQQVPRFETLWNIWLIMTGRGWGKTRTANETIRLWVESGRYKRIHYVAHTASDARDTMVEGPSGLLTICPPWFMPMYEPSKRRLTFPNGATIILFHATEPDALRGPQCDAWWADEVAAWPKMQDTWDMLQFGARLGSDVRGIVTTTPRPRPLIKKLVAKSGKGVHVTTGSTYENRANLAPNFLRQIEEDYGKTRLGRQEIEGKILDDNPNALWLRKWIDQARLKEAPDNIFYTVVGVDPAATSKKTSDETGIIVAGRDKRKPAHYYVLNDMSRTAARPRDWASSVINAYRGNQANIIVAESNNGGEMVESTIRLTQKVQDGDDVETPNIPIKLIHASKGKATRAEPVSSLYEQGRVHHVGVMEDLESQMVTWEPGEDSPDRVDALVWAITYLTQCGGGLRTGLNVMPWEKTA